MDQESTSDSNEDDGTVDCDVENGSTQIRKETVEVKAEKPGKKAKRGIIYLSKIPKYMNVAMIREMFSDYGKVGRVYLQLADNGWS